MAEVVRALAEAGGPGLLLRRASAGAGGGTCLHVAAAAGRLPESRWLLRLGGPALIARRRLAAAGGGTCLHAAAGEGHLRVAEALVAAAASVLPAVAVAELLHGRDGAGRTAWAVAQVAGHGAVAELIMRAATTAAAAAAGEVAGEAVPSPLV